MGVNSATGNTITEQAGTVDIGAVVTLTTSGTPGDSGDLVNASGRGIRVGINITALGGTNTPSLTVTIQGKDSASGQYYTILASTALTGTGFTKLTVYPGATASNNVVANDIVPGIYKISYTMGGTNPAVTATIGVSLIA